MSPLASRVFHTYDGLLPIADLHTLSAIAMKVIVDHGLRRRSAVRYKLRLPVIFHWTDGEEHTEGGFTSDVALDGALIISSTCPPVGTDVRIEVLVPAPNDNEKEIRIECMGKVSRLVDYPGSRAFGVHGYFSDDQLTRRFRDDSGKPLRVLPPEQQDHLSPATESYLAQRSRPFALAKDLGPK